LQQRDVLPFLKNPGSAEVNQLLINRPSFVPPLKLLNRAHSKPAPVVKNDELSTI